MTHRIKKKLKEEGLFLGFVLVMMIALVWSGLSGFDGVKVVEYEETSFGYGLVEWLSGLSGSSLTGAGMFDVLGRGLRLMDTPAISSVVLNTTSGNNLTTENLTAYPQGITGSNVSIYDWRLNGSSIAVLNMPFDHDDSGGSGKTKDYSQSSNNGTEMGGITWSSSAGANGTGAYEFDGDDDYIEIYDGRISDAQQGSIEAWVKFDKVEDNDAILCYGGGNVGTPGIFGLSIKLATNYYFRVLARSDSGSMDAYRGSTTLSNNQWYHVAVTSDSSTWKIYVNGAEETLTLLAGSNNGDWFADVAVAETDKTTLGSVMYDGSIINYLNGTLDNVKIYESTLTPQQIKALYENRTDIWTASETSLDDNWSVEVTPNDGTSDGTAVQSDNLTIIVAAANSAPTATAVNVTSTDSENRTNGTLEGEYTFTDSDGGDTEDDNETQWYNGTELVSDLENETLVDSANTTAGENWSFSVRVYDGTEWSAWVNASMVIENAAPDLASVVLNSTLGTNLTTENLTAYDAGTADTDGDNVSLIYDWRLNGSSIAVLNMPFENNATGTNSKDYSSFGNDGAVTGATYNATGGYDGEGAYEFDGSNDYINTTENEVFNFETWPFTIAAWFRYQTRYLDQIESIVGFSHDTGVSNENHSAGIYISTGDTNQFFGFARDSSGNQISATAEVLQPGIWYHAALVKNESNKLTLYINGKKNSTATVQTADFNYSNGGKVYIGSTDNSTGGLKNLMMGSIDDVFIFNHSLSADQIAALYNNRTDLLSSDETAVDDNWSVEVTPNDGEEDGIVVESNEVVVLAAANNAPGAPELVEPLNESSITNRTPELVWNNSVDADGGDTLTYQVVLDNDSDFTSTVFNVSNIAEGTTNTTYQISNPLDVDTTFFWKVIADDGTVNGTWSDTWNFTVDSYLAISIVNGNVSFGPMANNEANNTTDNSPEPFLVENAGNIFVNFTVTGTQLFTQGGFPSGNFQFKIDENSSETGSFNVSNSTTDWTNVPSSSSIDDVSGLNWSDASDLFEVDINITVPDDEYAGDKSSTITFEANS